MEAWPSLLEQIRDQQFDDGVLCKIRDKVLKGNPRLQFFIVREF